MVFQFQLRLLMSTHGNGYNGNEHDEIEKTVRIPSPVGFVSRYSMIHNTTAAAAAAAAASAAASFTRLAARVFPPMPGQSLVVVADSFCCYDCRCSGESYHQWRR